MTPSVSIVIRCRNEEAHIGRLLTGILRQSRRPDEILVVDSGSTDATLAIASAFPVTVVRIDHDDFSFGAACNFGCERAGGDIVVFVSAHCYPAYDTWIARLVAPFAAEDVALTYGRQVGPPGARFSEQRLFARWYPERSVARQRHPFCNNANAAIRRSLWGDGVRYDEHLTGLEDLDWAKRAIERGCVLSYVADAPIYHVHDESFAGVINRYRREAIAHRQIYDEQAMTIPQAVRVTLLNISQDLAAARRQGELADHAVDIARFRLGQFYGTYRGLNQRGPVTNLLRERFFFPGEQRSTPPPPLTSTDQAIDYDAEIDFAELNDG